VFLHGAAGDLAEAEEGQVGMTATDVIACLGEALNRLMKPVSDQA
jgi:NAD(P)H-hydrate repair Nnr-like enzyme with NAD(P)H-hydrate dehydratase domain